MQNLFGDKIRLRFQWIVNRPNRKPGLYFSAAREIARRVFLVATMRRISGNSRSKHSEPSANERLLS